MASKNETPPMGSDAPGSAPGPAGDAPRDLCRRDQAEVKSKVPGAIETSTIQNRIADVRGCADELEQIRKLSHRDVLTCDLARWQWPACSGRQALPFAADTAGGIRFFQLRFCGHLCICGDRLVFEVDLHFETLF
jgi:hypothetical protein